ncbi:resistance protein, partial [Trifolium pratense]
DGVVKRAGWPMETLEINQGPSRGLHIDLPRSYGQALDVHKKRVTPERLEKWTNALTSLANFRGCHMQPAKGIYEFHYIYEIIQEVSKHVACSIGLDYRVEKVMRFLTFGSDNDRVCVVGICGAHGIGKTTLAREVYHFHGGTQFDCNSTMFESVDEGMPMAIKHMLNQKKVFLILEDVHDSEVLKAIVKLTTFFGFEGLETYASGHPFILEVIGSYLSGKSIEECESALHKYKQIPNGDIKKILQVSFDSLEKSQQNMLIHIALHLKEQELAIVEDMLHCKYGVCPKNDTRVLLKKSLIKINENGQVILHGLTQDMLKENIPLEDTVV